MTNWREKLETVSYFIFLDSEISAGGDCGHEIKRHFSLEGSTSWNQDRQEIYNLRYADDTTLMAESEEELKGLLMRMEEESEKVDLKLNIQKTKIMASGPITSW